MGPDQNAKMVPYLASGEVVKGFGRGSKELGIPTGTCTGVETCKFYWCIYVKISLCAVFFFLKTKFQPSSVARNQME
jgi:hypothetical protein